MKEWPTYLIISTDGTARRLQGAPKPSFNALTMSKNIP
jgi:hypothetical protein